MPAKVRERWLIFGGRCTEFPPDRNVACLLWSGLKQYSAWIRITGGKSTSDDDGTRNECQEKRVIGVNRRSASEPGDRASSAKDNGKTTSGNRRRARTQGSWRGDEGSAVETDSALKVLGGGQPLVDDCDDADFETRKVGQGSQSFLFCESKSTRTPSGMFHRVIGRM